VSLTDNSRVIIYDCNMFIIQATGHKFDFMREGLFKMCEHLSKIDVFNAMLCQNKLERLSSVNIFSKIYSLLVSCNAS